MPFSLALFPSYKVEHLMAKSAYSLSKSLKSIVGLGAVDLKFFCVDKHLSKAFIYMSFNYKSLFV